MPSRTEKETGSPSHYRWGLRGRRHRTSEPGRRPPRLFGPVRERPPFLAEVAALRPADACWVTMFGHLGLMRPLRRRQGPVIGRLAAAPRRLADPVFGRYEEFTVEPSRCTTPKTTPAISCARCRWNPRRSPTCRPILRQGPGPWRSGWTTTSASMTQRAGVGGRQQADQAGSPKRRRPQEVGALAAYPRCVGHRSRGAVR